MACPADCLSSPLDLPRVETAEQKREQTQRIKARDDSIREVHRTMRDGRFQCRAVWILYGISAAACFQNTGS
jgi:hypothetical protein